MAFHISLIGLASFFTHWLPPCSQTSESASLSIPRNPTHYFHLICNLLFLLLQHDLAHKIGLFLLFQVLSVLQVKHKTKNIWRWNLRMRENMLLFLVLSYHPQYDFPGSIHLLANCMILFFFAPVLFHYVYGPHFVTTRNWGMGFHNSLELHTKHVCW